MSTPDNLQAGSAPGTEPEPELTAADAAAQAAADLDLQDMRWIRNSPTLLGELRLLNTPDEGDRVQFAAARAIIAMLERIGRASRRDLPEDES